VLGDDHDESRVILATVLDSFFEHRESIELRRGATRDPAIDGCDTPLVKFDELARDARAPVLVDKGSLLSKKGGAPV